MTRSVVRYELLPVSASQMKAFVEKWPADVFRAFPAYWSPEICFAPPEKFPDNPPWYWPENGTEVHISDDRRSAWIEASEHGD